jgi:DnaJ like chaperone protein
MSIWGKIVGGAAGFALGGPLGALLGGIAGHAVDRSQEQVAAPGGERRGGVREETRRIGFTIAVIGLGAKMAKADGTVTADEVQAFKEVFKIPKGQMGNVGRVFDLAKRDSHGFEPYAEQVATMFRAQPAVLEDLLDGLFHIARADNVYDPKENKFLAQVAQIFGFSDADFARIREGHVGPDKSDPYTIIGVSRDATDDAIKAQYRKLIRDHHPDKLIAQGMPQEFIDVATEKLATINDAYDRIEKERVL